MLSQVTKGLFEGFQDPLQGPYHKNWTKIEHQDNL